MLPLQVALACSAVCSHCLQIIFAKSRFLAILVQNFLYFFFFCIKFAVFLHSDTINHFSTRKLAVFVFFSAFLPHLHQTILKGDFL